jgi:predicted  nucleic acid-binding Zn-ribbon protein
MDATIVVAAFSLVGTLFGSYLASNKTTAVMQEQIKDIKEDINKLSTRVDKHNNLVERMAKVETQTDGLERRMEEVEKAGGA